MSTNSAARRLARTALNWGPPILLTGIAMGWSVAAIGSLLAQQAPHWLAYTAAGSYDALWVYALVQSAAHRRRGSAGTVPNVLGWVFLAVTIAVLLTHGLLIAGPVVAIVGALVPVLAKLTLGMALDQDATRISPAAQWKIDALRAGVRDRIALERTAGWAKASGVREAARLQREESRALGKAHQVRHKAAEELFSALQRQPLPELGTAVPSVPDSFGLISEDDIAELLNRALPEDWRAGGTPIMGSPALGPGTPPDVALQLLAAEIYAADPPPSLRQFRERMRAEMVLRDLRCSNALLDSLYRHEEQLRAGGTGTP